MRRDTCNAVQKILRRTTELVFASTSERVVREYVQRQFRKILEGRVSIHDFIFSKEVRLGSYKAKSNPPAALVALQRMKQDPRAEPKYGERVSYVVVCGSPDARLKDLVVSPHTFLKSNLKLNSRYYISKQILPALQRLLELIKYPVHIWYSNMPRTIRPVSEFIAADENKTTLTQFFATQKCLLCEEIVKLSETLCEECKEDKQTTYFLISGKTIRDEENLSKLLSICSSCCGVERREEIDCSSIDCPNFFERLTLKKKNVSNFVLLENLYK